MKMEQAFALLVGLQLGEHRIIYTSPGGVSVTVTHTGKLSDQDYAVGLIIPGHTEFYLTHVRLLFDLYLKRLSNLEHAMFLFGALEEVYEGSDPVQLGEGLGTLDFPMMLDEPVVNLVYTQLLMIEQDFNYGLGPGARRRSTMNPPREYLARFVRWVASGNDEIDRIVTHAVRNYPPPVRYRKAP